jgi:hypothetical protein
MTEEEAETKWCPQARVIVAFGENMNQAATANCIASSCMAWRWKHRPNAASSAYPDGEGFCGLAGTPQ